MKVRMKIDMRQIHRAIKNLDPVVKKSRKELVEQAAKGFVRTIATITPPGSQHATGMDAKKQGEAAIINDLAKIMKAVRSKRNAQLQSAQEIHKRFRDARTGRVNPRNLQKPYPVSSTEYNALKKTLLLRVGWLAAGWLPAAKKLNVKLPEWIKRHVTGAGLMSVTSDGRRFRIEISNTVKFVGNVKDLERRIGKAVTYQANAMQRQADYLLHKAVKKAGF